MRKRADGSVVYVRARQEGKDAERVDFSDRVRSFTYEDNERKADKATITLDNFDLSHFDKPVLKKGTILELQWGYPGRLSIAREAVILKVTGFQVLSIEANGKEMLINRIQRVRTFENTRRSEIVHAIAKEHGYGDDARFIDDTEETFGVIAQTRLTDAQFVRRLADKEGFQFFIDFDGFHWHKRRVGQRPVRKFIFYTDPGQGEILEINIENDVSTTPGRVKMKGRDPVKKVDIDVAADAKETKREALAEVIEVVNPDDGATHLEKRVASEVVRTTPQATATAAKKEADGKYTKAQQLVVKLNMKTRGDGDLAAKSVIAIEGISKRLSGNYYVREAKHNITESYDVDMKCIRDGHSELATGASLVTFGSGIDGVASACKGCASNFLRILGEVMRVAKTEEKLIGAQAPASREYVDLIQYESFASSIIPGAPSELEVYVEGVTRLEQFAVTCDFVRAFNTANKARAGGMAARKCLVNCRALAVRLAEKDKAKTETKTAPKSDVKELDPVDVVDEETGEVRTEFRNLNERDTANFGSYGKDE